MGQQETADTQQPLLLLLVVGLPLRVHSHSDNRGRGP